MVVIKDRYLDSEIIIFTTVAYQGFDREGVGGGGVLGLAARATHLVSL